MPTFRQLPAAIAGALLPTTLLAFQFDYYVVSLMRDAERYYARGAIFVI